MYTIYIHVSLTNQGNSSHCLHWMNNELSYQQSSPLFASLYEGVQYIFRINTSQARRRDYYDLYITHNEVIGL